MHLQPRLVVATGLIALTLVGCAELAPTARTSGQVAPAPADPRPPAGAAPAVAPAGVAPSQPAQGMVAADVARSAPAQIVPIPPGPNVPAIPSALGLTVVGQGTVESVPDIAYVSAGVQTRGPTAREAQDANTAAMNQVLARIKGLGIAEQDIRTSGVNLQPVYDRNPNQLSGYMAHNQVTVTVREVRRAGEVLDQAISAGANQAAGLRFGIKDDSQLRRQALDQAVKSSRATADAMAAAAGLRVSGILSMTDESGGGGAVPVERAMMADAAQANVPIQPGQLAVTARVRVVYQFQ
jgi:uncharacterized protein YggE